MQAMTLTSKEYENNYFITNCGNVIRKNKVLKHNWRKSRSGAIYLTNRFWINGELKTEYTHRLVAKMFLGNIEGLTVNHKDKNTLNNHWTNLEILTMQENCDHKRRDYKLIKKVTLRKRLKIVRFTKEEFIYI
jgi:hypothetical protein